MTDIEAEARRRLNEAAGCKAYSDISSRKNYPDLEAMCRLLEEFEAYKREVNDSLKHYLDQWKQSTPSREMFACQFGSFILPKPVDPLVEALNELPCLETPLAEDAEHLRAALAKRGYEIREKAGE